GGARRWIGQRDSRREADPTRERHDGRSHGCLAEPSATAEWPRLMLNWIIASPAERRLLGEARLRGPTAWVVAIMSFSIVIIAAAGLALANTAGVLSHAIQARYSVEVPGAGANLTPLLAAVRSAPGVST